MTNYLIIFSVVLVMVATAGLIFIIKGKLDYEILKIEINGKIFEVEISDTALKRAKGLSGREMLKEDNGMLFVFEKPSKPSFWMAGMNFPIDIIWINENKIVDISKNVQPPQNNELPIIISPSPPEADQPRAETEIDKVLELSAGSTEKFNIKIGNELKILE